MQAEFEFRIVKDHDMDPSNPSLPAAQVLTVGAGSGIFGRAPGCRYSVPDPSRVISREHALIERHQDEVYWTPRGSNPTQRRGEVLQSGKRHPLVPGDVLELGPYQVYFVARESKPFELSPLPLSPDADPVWLQDPLARSTWSIDAVLGSVPEPIASPLPVEPTPLPVRTPVQSHRLWLDDLDAPSPALQSEPQGLQPTASADWVDALGLRFVQPWDPMHTERLKVVIHQSLALLLSLLEARRLVRQELGGHQTTIRARSNNPLKVAVSVPQALAQLIHPDSEAYLSTEQAFEELSSDLLNESGHLLNGIRHVMAKLDQHLAPRHIERQLERMSGITLPIGVHRKARMWDLYCQQFQWLRGERSLPFASLLEDVLRDAPGPRQDT
ncbi:FHA domain-containing protein [Limnobacter humi]|uniref:FHA domain-containing protein n=1 Tax=Limnobacter humi TaxID=1778671 RepID=A0ABT1WD61_9BURK|nr:type VI secretion system-associated FHA domain protein [Limnobacter humi]MCQ8895459.1 FHA domain-containing protein [Limnobacter humi]